MTPTPRHISRRKLLRVTALGIGVLPAITACSPELARLVGRQVPLAGRRFVSDSPTISLVAAVRDEGTAERARDATRDLFAEETAPILNYEASVIGWSSTMLAEAEGVDGRWTIVAGAAGVKSFHRGVFFAVDRFCWSLEAFRTEEDDAFDFVIPLVPTLKDRFLGAHPGSNSGAIDLWTLLPDEQDLGGTFHLVETFDHED